MADKIVKITFRIPEEDHALLTAIKDSGNVKEDTFAPLIRLYCRMGLLLHKNGIQSLEDLNAKLARLTSDEVNHLEDRLLDRLSAILPTLVKEELKRTLPPSE